MSLMPTSGVSGRPPSFSGSLHLERSVVYANWVDPSCNQTWPAISRQIIVFAALHRRLVWVVVREQLPPL